MNKFLCDFEMKTDRLIQIKKLNLMLINQKKTNKLLYFAAPVND